LKAIKRLRSDLSISGYGPQFKPLEDPSIENSTWLDGNEVTESSMLKYLGLNWAVVLII
jgi:hypothetical protein